MGKKSELLPFPLLREPLESCLRCGYPLEGIPAPGQCPECGLPFEDGRTILQIFGVARSQGGPRWRQAVWVVITIAAVIYFQLLGFILFAYPWVSAVLFFALLAGVLTMVTTGKQRWSGSECFAFTPAGFARWVVHADPSTRIFTPWPRGRKVMAVRVISPVWARLRIAGLDERGRYRVLLECGFRLPRPDAPPFEHLLGQLLGGTQVSPADLDLERTVFLRDPEPMPKPTPEPTPRLSDEPETG